MVRIIKVEFAGKFKMFHVIERGDYAPYEYAEKLAFDNEGHKVELTCSVDGVSEFWYHRGWYAIVNDYGDLLEYWCHSESDWKQSCSHPSEWQMDLLEVETNPPWRNKEAEKAFKALISNEVGLLNI